MNKRNRVFLLFMAVLMLCSCTYNMTITPSAAPSDDASSSLDGTSSERYPPEKPAFNESLPAQDGGELSSNAQSDASGGQSSTQTGTQSSSEASSSKATSSKDASSQASSSKAASSVQASSEAQSPAKTTAPANELRAVWISYLDLETMLKGKNESGAQSAIDKAFNNVVNRSMNAVILQVRPFADALYQSNYFPWSRILTGTQGKDPGYDPLELMVASARARGLEIHVWINPYRILTSTSYSNLASGHIAREWNAAGNDYTIAVDGKGIFFNPARKQVRDLIVDGVTELVANYDIDGVHYDDYFYPTTASSFDSKAYNEYKAGGGGKSLSAWRMENVNKLISATYSAVKAVDSSVQFGVSPNGNIDQNYSTLYADVKTWCKNEGYIDYIMPQLYYGFENASCPYEQTLKAWNDMITVKGIKFYPGLAVYKIGTTDQWAGAGSQEWLSTTTMLRRQVASARAYSMYDGFALYRYDSFINPASSVASRVATEMENLKAVL